MAAGDPLFALHPWSGSGPDTGFARKDTINRHLALVFDAGAAEEMEFKVLMQVDTPTTTTIVFTISMGTATTGNVGFDVSIEKEQNVNSDGYATAVQAAATNVPGTSGDQFKVSVNLTQAQMDSVVKGDTFRLKVARRADTAPGPAHLMWIGGEEG